MPRVADAALRYPPPIRRGFRLRRRLLAGGDIRVKMNGGGGLMAEGGRRWVMP